MIVTDGKLKIGDVGLIEVGGFVGQLIKVMQFLNGSPWKDCHLEHSFVVTDPDRMWGFEAQPGGAHFFDINEKYGNENIVWIRPANLDAQQQASLVQVFDQLKGTPYSFVEYDALLVHRLRLPLPGLKTYVNNSDHMICSQIIAEGYRRIAVELFGGEWPGYVTPVDYFVMYKDKVVG
jgi:hypothetical protein